MFLYKHKYAGHKIGSQKMTFSLVSTDMETFLIKHFNILNNTCSNLIKKTCSNVETRDCIEDQKRRVTAPNAIAFTSTATRLNVTAKQDFQFTATS